MKETAMKTDPRTWWFERFLALQYDLARCLAIGTEGTPNAEKDCDAATGHLAALGCGFHTNVYGPKGATLAMQTTDAARSNERLVLRAWRDEYKINWNLELERPRARRDEEYAETDASRYFQAEMGKAAKNVADKLLRIRNDGYANWVFCQNTSLLFQHPAEVEKAARHVLRATTVIQKWNQRRDKPSVQELAEKLSADAEMSLTFAPRGKKELSQIRLMVEINDRHTLSIDHRATREVKRSLDFRATTSRTAEYASFKFQCDESPTERRSRLGGNRAGSVVLAYLDVRNETQNARDNLANALWAVTAHPTVASEGALRDAFDAEHAAIGRIALGSSARTEKARDRQTDDAAEPAR